MGNRLDHPGCKRLKDDEDAEAARAINHPPAFNRSNPAEWFAEIEEHFEEFHINTDKAKCELLIDELDWDVLELIDDIELCSSTEYAGFSATDQRYEHLKRIILRNLIVAHTKANKYE